MATSLNYRTDVSDLQNEGNRLASTGLLADARATLQEALDGCGSYENLFIGKAHEARIKRDMAVVSIRSVMSDARQAEDGPDRHIWDMFDSANQELVHCQQTLEGLAGVSELYPDLQEHRSHLLGEAAVSTTWRMRLFMARAVLDEPNRPAHLIAAQQMAEAALLGIMVSGNQYYATSFFGNVARLDTLRNQPAGANMRRAWGMVAIASMIDQDNFWPSLRTFMRTGKDVLLGTTARSILNGYI